ncbi:hypothetical protein F5Y14DRAFT_444313 [Nemania sp. NC0429]|nr:hypothetical protein F5Y14DRAFT_444313 [Nemania sp. NC0429]
MSDQPPPPPPHGTNPRKSSPNLPPGKYDIFIIPPHSSGAGFLYLPSLKPNVNSFAAGFVTALVVVGVSYVLAPAFRIWYRNFQGMGEVGMLVLLVAVGIGAWFLGRRQKDGGASSGNKGGPGNSWSYNPGDPGYSGGPYSGTGPPPGWRAPDPDGPPPPPPPHGSPPQPRSAPPPKTSRTEKPKSSWQERPQDEPKEHTRESESTKGSWERAREETRRKEEERKAKEAEQRKKDEIAKRIKELREKEAKERARREQEAKQQREQEAREREEREREIRERDLRDRLEREKALREKFEREVKEREAKEAREREAKEQEAARLKEAEAARAAEEAEAAEAAKKAKESETSRRGAYAFSSVGEKTNPWPNGKPPAQAPPSAPPSTAPSVTPTASPSAESNSTRRPPPPTAQSFRGTDDDAYSHHTFEQSRSHTRRRSGETIFTESSYAPSQSTSRTTPPPSARGPYTTKDPDKIVIKAVYGFLNQFSKTPASQLVSGVGHVTDGLILRITTEGLFIDDDVRGVPQREWDVKAWTLRLMEVWCPAHTPADSAAPRPASKPATPRFRFAARSQSKMLMGDDADAYLTELLNACKDDCRTGSHGGLDSASSRSTSQPGEWKSRGMHVLRATIRDQEGKRFLFVVGEEEGWKIAVGLQRLRKGTQVRQLGIQPMPLTEARGAVETLGW